jgi:DNA-binding Xre family transcriptional regulator
VVKYDKIKKVIKLISYKPFYETLFKKGITEYSLIFKQGFSANTFHRMKKGEAITTKTMDTLCFILDCTVPEILEYEKPE